MAWLGRFDDFNGVNIEPDERSKNGRTAIQRSKTVSTSTVGKRSLPTSTAYQSSEHVPSGYCKICDITSKMHIVSVLGVIIGKELPKSIISKKAGNGSERHLLALTVCDEPLCFINVTCWGSREFVNFLAAEISIGDVVEIKGANVQAKSNNSADDRFKPWTPSPCHLNLSDTQGSLLSYNGLDALEYAALVHTPTRANNDYYTLEDIQANGMNLQGEHVNILAAVKKVWPVREITTKLGKKTRKVDVVVCDEMCPSFHLTLWDSFVSFADKWIPLQTVIFAADVKISFSEFHSTMVASTSSKTILTVNPDTPEAHCLQQLVMDQSSSQNLFAETKDPDVGSITNVLTVRQARALETDGQAGYGVLYAFLSHFDIDADLKTVLKEVCCRCRKHVLESAGYMCTNPDCVTRDQPHDDIPDLEYSVTVNLTDHTGSLMLCRLSQGVLEQILSCKAKEFKDLGGDEKTRIKWSYLLERVKAVLKIKTTEGKGYIRVMALQKARHSEIMEQGFSHSVGTGLV